MPASPTRPAVGSSAEGYAAALSILGFPAGILEGMNPAALMGTANAADPVTDPEGAETEQVLVYAALLHRLTARTRAVLVAGTNKHGGIGGETARLRGAVAARAAWIIDQTLVAGPDTMPADELVLPGAPDLIAQASAELAWMGHQLFRMCLIMHGAGSMEAATLEQRVFGAERAAAGGPAACAHCGLPGVGELTGGRCEDVPDGLLVAASVLAASASGLSLAVSELRRPDAPPDARAWSLLLRSLGEASSLAATSAVAAGVAERAGEGALTLLVDDED